jgi:hypothetical protein
MARKILGPAGVRFLERFADPQGNLGSAAAGPSLITNAHRYKGNGPQDLFILQP